MTFDSLKLSPALMESIKTLGYATPTPIQQKAIPHVLSGRDLLGLAQTGTGKTAAFALPILHNLYKEKSVKTRVLVIAPTRELAEQIKDSFIELSGKNRINIITVYGGVSMTVQVQNLRRNPDVIVACPGRLLDHLKKGTCDLSGVKTLVLDEADQMFDMGFFPDIKRIIARVPVARQTLLFSATMPAEVRKLTEAVLKDAVTVEVDYAKPVATVEQALYPVNDQTQKTPVLLRLLHKNDSGSVLVFTRTKHRAKRLAEALGKAGHTATSLQGNLSQNQRQIALSGFKSGKFRIMVATDIAARGIDVSLITHVINYDMPATVEAYTHRIGRTGRAERTGSAHTLITSEDHGLVRAIERTLSAKIERRQILHPANQKTA